MLSEAGTLSITHAHGISVETLAPLSVSKTRRTLDNCVCAKSMKCSSSAELISKGGFQEL